MWDEIKLEYLKRTNGTKSVDILHVAYIRHKFTRGGYLFVNKVHGFFLLLLNDL